MSRRAAGTTFASRGERPWMAQVLPDPYAHCLAKSSHLSCCCYCYGACFFIPLHYDTWHLTTHFSRHQRGLSCGDPAATSHRPLQVSCHKSTQQFLSRLPKINNLPQNSPSWAVWSTRPVCWAGGRQEASRSSIRSLQSLLSQQSVVLKSLGDKSSFYRLHYK